jgi:hypothetical protein
LTHRIHFAFAINKARISASNGDAEFDKLYGITIDASISGRQLCHNNHHEEGTYDVANYLKSPDVLQCHQTHRPKPILPISGLPRLLPASQALNLL